MNREMEYQNDEDTIAALRKEIVNLRDENERLEVALNAEKTEDYLREKLMTATDALRAGRKIDALYDLELVLPHEWKGVLTRGLS